jgi:hypothetical protein
LNQRSYTATTAGLIFSLNGKFSLHVIYGRLRGNRDKAIDEEYRDALKGSLNSHALVHPDHPLRVKGEDGIRVYIGANSFPLQGSYILICDRFIGTASNGEKRLLMKTEQADYLRQWIYAAGLTDKLIPIPAVDQVSTEATFPVVTQELFKEATDFKTVQKVGP